MQAVCWVFECEYSSMAKFSMFFLQGQRVDLSICSVISCLGVFPCMGQSNVQHYDKNANLKPKRQPISWWQKPWNCSLYTTVLFKKRVLFWSNVFMRCTTTMFSWWQVIFLNTNHKTKSTAMLAALWGYSSCEAQRCFELNASMLTCWSWEVTIFHVHHLSLAC